MICLVLNIAVAGCYVRLYNHLSPRDKSILFV
ncbi:hypothetical protein BJP35_2264 [Enterobacter sp. J49]|nr:hypothetical protein BJP35_2264 [Enterobacter sp. J49]